MSAARRKGTAAETAVVRHLHLRGWPHAERRALHGNHDRGDIAGLPGVVLEIKNTKTINLAGWVTELEDEITNDQADTGAVIIKRRGTTHVGDWYAVLPVDRYLDLLKEAGR